MRVKPIIAAADYLGIHPKATKIFAYNVLDIATKLVSFVVRSRFMKGGKVGKFAGTSAVAAGTGAMVMSLGKSGDKFFDVDRKPSPYVPKEKEEDETTKHVPSIWDNVVTMNGFLAVRGMGHSLMASVITIAFCAVNIASGMPVFNGEDKDGNKIVGKEDVKTGARLAQLGGILGAALAFNENADNLYRTLAPKTQADIAKEQQEEREEQAKKAASG